MEDKIENKEGEGGRQDISSEGKPRGLMLRRSAKQKLTANTLKLGQSQRPRTSVSGDKTTKSRKKRAAREMEFLSHLSSTSPSANPLRPTLFELIAQDQLRDLIQPALRYIVAVPPSPPLLSHHR